MWNEFIWALIRGKHHVFSQVAPLLISLFSELCNALLTRKNASQVLQTNHESWSMQIVDERLWWHFWSVFYDMGLLPYAHSGHTRHDAHCRSYARNMLTEYSVVLILASLTWCSISYFFLFIVQHLWTFKHSFCFFRFKHRRQFSYIQCSVLIALLF